ncbi:hypothetical protein [Nocardia sp. NBC_00511]|uniref:hypothetical protein n=1 Tax=Nocardia sp. NBC_00511 TaxID=2903591 RepID=UPI0030E276F9
MLTDHDARHAVITAIEAGEASRHEFDIDAIVSDIREVTGDYNVEAVDAAEFWTVVARHAR